MIRPDPTGCTSSSALHSASTVPLCHWTDAPPKCSHCLLRDATGCLLNQMGGGAPGSVAPRGRRVTLHKTYDVREEDLVGQVTVEALREFLADRVPRRTVRSYHDRWSSYLPHQKEKRKRVP